MHGCTWNVILACWHARAAFQQANIMHGEGYSVKNKECMCYIISNSSLQSASRNWLFRNKNTYKRSRKYFEKYDYIDAVFLEQINK